MSEYISIKEFAKLAGVSTQAIYQRINKDLQSYCKEVDGKKTLDIAALELFKVETIQERLQSDCKAVDNDLQSALTETITVLREQLAIKDKQIEALTTALMNAQQSEQQAHALHAGTMQQAMIETRTATNETASAEQQERRGWKWWKGGNKQ